MTLSLINNVFSTTVKMRISRIKVHIVCDSFALSMGWAIVFEKKYRNDISMNFGNSNLIRKIFFLKTKEK